MATRKTMRRIKWAFVVVISLIILALAGFITYTIVSRSTTNEYVARLKLCLNAALVTEGIHVKAEDGYHELDEESYRMLFNYLTRTPVLALTGGDLSRGDRVELRIGQDPLVIVPLGDEGDKAVVHFETEDKSYRIQLRHDNLMRNILGCTDASHYYLPGPIAE